MAVVTETSIDVEIRNSLTFILNHTDWLWPRTISTYSTKGAQVLVNNFEEAMVRFKAANFIDCRISAYPKYTDYYINRTGIAPTTILADLDEDHFTPEEFELAVTRTYDNFYNVLGSRPTQLWTGGGVHTLTPQKVDVFERSEIFGCFDQPSRRFLQFEEQLLTDGKADPAHWSTVSFNNCMLRLPGSFNSKAFRYNDEGKIVGIPPEAKVKIIKRWDGVIPIVDKPLLQQYHSYLQFSKINDIRKQQQMMEQRRCCYVRAVDIDLLNYGYIDRLYNKLLDNFRKMCIWKILVPFFINVKKLPRLEAFNRTKSWLDRCNSLSRLDFSPKQKIDYSLDHLGTYWPPHQDRLEDVDKLFYERLKKEGIIC